MDYAVVQLLKQKKVSIETSYLVVEVDIWSSIAKDKLQEPRLT